MRYDCGACVQVTSQVDMEGVENPISYTKPHVILMYADVGISCISCPQVSRWIQYLWNIHVMANDTCTGKSSKVCDEIKIYGQNIYNKLNVSIYFSVDD